MVTVVTVLSLASLFLCRAHAAFVQLILALVFGVLLTMRVGGADMPITISLLNSLSGVAERSRAFHLRIHFWWQWAGLLGPLGLS